MTIAIVGVSGFVGQHMANYLLSHTQYELRAVCRNPRRSGLVQNPRMDYVAADVADVPAMTAALRGCETVVYLVHLMKSPGDGLEAAESAAAEAFAAAARQAGVKRVVYLGGLGDEATRLSAHLASRHRTGEVLRAGLPLVIELRASMIVGRGSIGFDIIRTIAAKLPVLVVPRWANTLTQPIALEDALAYLAAALSVEVRGHEIIEIGGPEALTYPMLVARYGKAIGLPGITIMVPGVPRRLAAWWLGHYMDRRHAAIGTAMVDSLHHPMVVRSIRAAELFPDIKPRPVIEAFGAGPHKS